MTTPTITDSRIKKGTLTIGTDPDTVDISCQASAVSLEPSTTETGEALEVLCGDDVPATHKTAWALKFTGIQDFTNVDGFLMFALEHDGETHAYTWKPAEVGPTFSGMCTVKALTIGGEVGPRVTTDAEWPATKPAVTWPPPP